VNKVKIVGKKIIPIWLRRPERGRFFSFSKKVKPILEKLKKEEVTWNELNTYVKKSRRYDNNHMFEKVIKLYDNKVNFKNIHNPEFYGEGYGVDVLNVYRKVNLKNNENLIAFEKIYRAGSTDLKKNMWFYENVKPFFMPEIKIPSIYFILKGEQVFITYFEWIKGVGNLDNKERKNLFKLFDRLSKSVAINGKVLPSYITNFRKEHLYNTGLNLGGEWLKNNFSEEDFDIFISLNQCISSIFPKVKFTHGDLNPMGNFFKNGIIDFDRCGVYPYHYDFTFYLSKSYLPTNIYEYYSIVSEYGYLPKKINRNEMLSLLYFSFLFYSRKKEIQCSDVFLKQLWIELVKVYEEIN